MEKVLVFGDTVRQARNFYKGKANQAVGARTYVDYGNEKCDIEIFVDEKKKPKTESKSKK